MMKEKVCEKAQVNGKKMEEILRNFIVDQLPRYRKHAFYHDVEFKDHYVRCLGLTLFVDSG